MKTPHYPKAIIIGQSHANALHAGASEFLATKRINLCSEDARKATTLELFEKYVTLAIEKAAQELNPNDHLDPTKESIDTYLARNDTIVMTIFGGNIHNVISLVKAWDDFDFILPSNPDLTLDREAQLVPYAAIKGMLKYRISNPHLDRLKTMSNLLPTCLINIETPPPLGDDKFVLEYMDPFFTEKFGVVTEVIPRTLRHKIWRLSCEIYIEFCRENGIRYHNTPSHLMEENLFLAKQAYLTNATHANSWFGRGMAESAIQLFEQKAS